jgi:sec-independent protein translocase protein TatA
MYYIANAMNPTVWIVVGVIALLLFGGQKIPEMMRGLGSGMKEFKKGMSEDDPKDDELRKEKEREAEIRRRVEEEMRKG